LTPPLSLFYPSWPSKVHIGRSTHVVSPSPPRSLRGFSPRRSSPHWRFCSNRKSLPLPIGHEEFFSTNLFKAFLSPSKVPPFYTLQSLSYPQLDVFPPLFFSLIPPSFFFELYLSLRTPLGPVFSPRPDNGSPRPTFRSIPPLYKSHRFPPTTRESSLSSPSFFSFVSIYTSKGP